MLTIVLVIVALWVTAAWLVHTNLKHKAITSSKSATQTTLGTPVTSTTIVSTTNTTGSAIPSITEDSITTTNATTANFSITNSTSSSISATAGASLPQSGANLPSKLENDASEEEKEQTRRQKLLRKRRRLISQLYDPNQDADEILRLYFTGSGTPSNASSRSASRDRDSSTFRLLGPASPSASRDRESSTHRLLGPTSRSASRDRESTTFRLLAPASPSASRDKESSTNRFMGLATRRENVAVRYHMEPPTLRRRSEPVPSTSPGVPSSRAEAALGRISLAEDVPRVPVVVRPSDTTSLGSSDDSGIGVEVSDAASGLHEPTIFGTVADDQTPRDNSTKRGLPQTPKTGAKSCPYNGVEHLSHPPEWATAPDDDNSLVYEDGVLVSGSLRALVQHAVPTAVYYPDTAYLFAFLLSSRLFIKPHELLQRVCDVGFTQQGLKGNDLGTVNKEKLGRFVPHMVQLLGEWSETFPYDFRDERMMGGVRTMTHRCIALEPSLRRDVTQVLHNLLNKLTQLERYEEGLAKLPAPPPADFITQPTDITEVCQSPLVMAQQLTHIELEKLSYIGPEEFVQAFAKDNLDACYKDLKKTNNLESYIQWFNRLSYLVATHACTHVKKKQRVRVIEWWIEVARECFNIGNFNSLMGIIAGLNMSIVSRLKKTWSKVQSAKFSVLEHQMDPSSNFSSYRSTLKAAMWRSAGAVDDRQKIVIPFFSLLVKDLYFLNEGCASRLPNGHINFDKFWQLAKQVTEFMAWKQVTCPFEKAPDVINYMQTTNVLTETGLALASFECEGPDNSYEKERYKNLKADTQQSTESDRHN